MPPKRSASTRQWEWELQAVQKHYIQGREISQVAAKESTGRGTGEVSDKMSLMLIASNSISPEEESSGPKKQGY